MKTLVKGLVGAASAVVAGAACGAAATHPGTRANKLVRHQLAHVQRRLRYLDGVLQGAGYRLSGRHPDLDVEDNVLADRVRSSLGKLEHRLDLPRVHVMVERRVVLLHGEVGGDGEAAEIERAVAAVPGVAGVESFLRAGLTPGDTRPSEGRAARQPSEALVRLTAAAEAAGVAPGAAASVVRGVLGAFADRLPPGEREHVRAHLPADVLPLLVPPRRIPAARPPRSVHELVDRIAATTPAVPPGRSGEVTASLLQTLRGLVPDEAADVAAVLPPEIRALWEGADAA